MHKKQHTLKGDVSKECIARSLKYITSPLIATLLNEFELLHYSHRLNVRRGKWVVRTFEWHIIFLIVSNAAS